MGKPAHHFNTPKNDPLVSVSLMKNQLVSVAAGWGHSVRRDLFGLGLVGVGSYEFLNFILGPFGHFTGNPV